MHTETIQYARSSLLTPPKAVLVVFAGTVHRVGPLAGRYCSSETLTDFAFNVSLLIS